MTVIRTRAVTSLVVGLLVVLGSACGPAPVADQGYVMVFREEFDGQHLRPVWQTDPLGTPLRPEVGNGVLTLRSRTANANTWGIVGSTGPRAADGSGYPDAESWHYGYFEARIRYTDNRWVWAGFWMLSMAKTNAWPGEDCRHLNAEWDIMENGAQGIEGAHPAASWSFTALHRNTSDSTADGYCGIPDVQRTHGTEHADKDLSDWHVWSGHWTEDEVCTYLDGVELNCMPPYDSTHQPMHLVLSIDYLHRCTGCPPKPAELVMQVDWVRVWQ